MLGTEPAGGHLEGRPLQIGVVGCGLVALAAHLPAIADLPDRFALAAIADPDPVARREAARR